MARRTKGNAAKAVTPSKAATNKRPPPASKRSMKGKNIVVMNSDHTKTTIPKAQVKSLQKMAAREVQEKMIQLLKSNSVFLDSTSFPVGVNGNQDLNWEEVAESCILAKIAAQPQNPIPLGPAVLKAYLWWFMIDRLRNCGGLEPAPTQAQVPQFPATGAMPVGWAKFVEHLMPFEDPLTHAVYQFKYTFTGVPATASGVLNPNAGVADFSYAALQNFALIPNAAPTGIQDLTWIFANTAYNFIADVTQGSFQAISSWFSSSGEYTAAELVPGVAPDASAVAIPYGHSTPNPGVYCQSSFFDEEMACVIHPPINAVNLTTGGNPNGAYFMIYIFDWYVKPLPQIFNASPVKSVAGNPNLASAGQLELILNYGFITHNIKYTIGARRKFLKMGQRLWCNLSSYCPYYYDMSLLGWHQAVNALLETVMFQPAANTGGGPNTGSSNSFSNASDILTVMIVLESILIARTASFAYPGLVLRTTDDIVSQTNYGNAFKNCNLNPVLADMLNVIAPTVKHGRLVVPIWDYRNYSTYGYNYSANITNTTVARWLKIGTDYISAVSNINDFIPFIGLNSTGFGTGPFAFWNTLQGPNPLAPYTLIGPGPNNTNQIRISEASQGQTVPLPVTYVLANTLGPAAPCVLAQSFIIRYNEIYAFGSGTWTVFNWAHLGGYSQQTQVTGQMDPSAVIFAVNVGAAPGSGVLTNFSYDQIRLSAYFNLDAESVGRSFAYATRISIVGPGGQAAYFDRFPVIQSLPGNSSTQNQLVYNTQEGPDSTYNKAVQSKSTTLHNTEAVHAALGPMHSAIIADNFAGIELPVPQAVTLVIRSKKHSVTAPYHTEQSASVTSYNSPNVIEDFFGTIFDIGTGIVTGIGHLIGGAVGGDNAGGIIANVGANLITDWISRKKINVHPAVRKVARSTNAMVAVKPLDRKTQLYAAEKSWEALKKMGIRAPISLVDEPQIDYDKLLTRIRDTLTMTEFTKFRNEC